MRKAHWFTVTLAVALLLSLLAVLPASASVTALPAQGPDTANAGATTGRPIASVFPISNLNEDQRWPAVAYNSQREEYLVVWHNEWPGNMDIYGQRVSKNGTLMGNWFAISAGQGDRYFPDVAYNSQANEYLVVWSHEDPTNVYSVYGQRLSATGQAQGAAFPIVQGTSGTAYDEPAVAYAYAADEYLVVFRQVGSGGYDINAHSYNSDCTLRTGDAFIMGTVGLPLQEPDVAYNRTRNEFLVVWEFWNFTDDDIWGQRVKMAGGLGTLGPALQITTDAKDQHAPAVAAIPKPVGMGQYLVVWDHRRTSTNGDIHARLVNGDGTLGTGFAVSEPEESQYYPAVAGYEHTQEYLVVWTHLFGIPPILFSDIKGRQVSSAGALLGTETWLGGLNADHAAVAGGPVGDFLVAFDDQPVLASNRDVYGRLWGNRLYLPLTLRNYH
jgi:hypothetical protein